MTPEEIARTLGSRPTRTEIENAEHEVLRAVARGWVRITGRDSEGRHVYRLTPEGWERARVILGLPPDAVVDPPVHWPR